MYNREVLVIGDGDMGLLERRRSPDYRKLDEMSLLRFCRSSTAERE